MSEDALEMWELSLHVSPQEEPMHDLAVGLAFIAMLLLPSCVAMHSMSRNSRDRVTSR